MSDVERPLIGVVACNKPIGLHPFNVVGEKYLLAIVDGAGGWPLILPALGLSQPIKTLLNHLDGIMLTGSASNIEPHHYQGPVSENGTLHDSKRDAATLPLIRAAIASAVPIFGICRGFQEMNVAFGGSLFQKLFNEGGFIEHREDEHASLDVQYGVSHEITIEPGGMINKAWGKESALVNSLHTQGIQRLGEGLQVEAYAPDGLVEAFSVKTAKEFALAVQWHPEWKVSENPFYQSIFKAFGDACRRRALKRVKNSWKS